MENNEITCHDCPLKWSCGLWREDAWNVSNSLCDCVDDRLVCGITDHGTIIKRQDLLQLWKKGIDTINVK